MLSSPVEFLQLSFHWTFNKMHRATATVFYRFLFLINLNVSCQCICLKVSKSPIPQDFGRVIKAIAVARIKVGF